MSDTRLFLDDEDMKIRAHVNDDDTFRVCINTPYRFGRIRCSRSMPMSIYSEVSRAFDFTQTDEEARIQYMRDRVEKALWELGQIKTNLDDKVR